MKLCRDLIKDLQKHIEDYSSIYEPEDRLEWQLVVSEVKSFLEAEYIVRVVDVDSSSVVLSHRFVSICRAMVIESQLLMVFLSGIGR